MSKKYREEVEKLGPRAAILGLFNTLTDIQGKKLANQLNGILMPYIIKDKQTDTDNKTNDSKNSYNNILERFFEWKWLMARCCPHWYAYCSETYWFFVLSFI